MRTHAEAACNRFFASPFGAVHRLANLPLVRSQLKRRISLAGSLGRWQTSIENLVGWCRAMVSVCQNLLKIPAVLSPAETGRRAALPVRAFFLPSLALSKSHPCHAYLDAGGRAEQQVVRSTVSTLIRSGPWPEIRAMACCRSASANVRSG
jgi:hypothetical protein